MREDQVAAAAVKVERGPQKARAHHRALDVPAGTARTPGAVPGRLARRLRLPQHEVEGIALVRIVGPVAALIGDVQHLGPGQMAQPAEGGPGIDVVVDAAARHVGETALDQRADGGDDVGDDVGGAGIHVRRADVQDLHVADEVRGPAIAEGAPVLTDLGRLAQDVVVDVGDVLDVAHGQPLALEVPHEHVGDRVGEGVAEVRGVVGRDAAHVEGDDRTGGLERLDRARQRVVDVHAVGQMTPRFCQVGDLVLRVADRRQDVLVVLAELRRRGPDRKARGAVGHGMAEDGEIAEDRGVHRLRHGEVLHLGIGERLVDAIDRPARHARAVQDLDPLGARLLARHGHQDLHDLVPIGRPRPRGGEARVGEQVGPLDGAAEPPVEVVAARGDIDVPVLRLEDARGNARRMVVPRLGRHLAAHQPARRLEVEHGEHRLEQ